MQYNKEEAKEKIRLLVEEFKKYYESGEAKKWKEEQTINYAINPLFEALGWNMKSPEEVDYQSHIESKNSKRPDYIFKLNGNLKFVVEAKSVKEDLNNQVYVQQALNYAYLKGLSWTVLTDFEETKIFCADRKYSKSNPLQNYFRDIPWTAYIDRFEDLWLLSKESFEKGIIDEVGEKELKKIPKVKMDKQFSLDLNDWRRKLENNIKRNNSLSSEELSESVQKILDRLVFIRTCEDRRIGVGEKLNALVRQHEESSRGKFISKLNEVYLQYDEKFNSKLFTYDEKNLSNRHLCEKLVIDDKVFYEIIRGMYNESDPTRAYDFSLINADILGSVYEQYLAYLQRGTAEKEKSKRKEHGIYYTPTYIVDYIVKNTLGEKLKECKKPEDVLKIKVLDPACGSGSFLIRAYDEFRQWYEKYKSKNKTDGEQTKLDEESGKGYRSFMDEVLKNCIYGVDLDPKAVELTQLNLLLKAADTRHRLPSLRNNIKCGDSLIDDPSIAGDKAFKWENEFKEIMDSGKFDVVIGNPPWVQSKFLSNEHKDYYAVNYEIAKKQYDLFSLFINRCSKIMSKNGILGYIVPDRFIVNADYEFFRRNILDNYCIRILLQVGEDVFESVEMPSAIIILEKCDSEVLRNNNLILSSLGLNEKLKKIKQKQFIENSGFIFNIFESSQDKKILNNLEEGCISLADLVYNGRGVEIGKKAEVISKTDGDVKFLIGSDIDRYQIKNVHYLKLGKKGINYKDSSVYKGEKLLIRKTGVGINAVIDKDSYVIQVIYIFRKKQDKIKLKYLLGLLNSKLINYYYFSKFGQRDRKIFPHLTQNKLLQLPMKIATEKEQEKLIFLVDNILERYKTINQSKNKNLDKSNILKIEIEKIDAEIDDLVYKLYGITEEEKKIIEESLN